MDSNKVIYNGTFNLKEDGSFEMTAEGNINGLVEHLTKNFCRIAGDIMYTRQESNQRAYREDRESKSKK